MSALDPAVLLFAQRFLPPKPNFLFWMEEQHCRWPISLQTSQKYYMKWCTSQIPRLTLLDS